MHIGVVMNYVVPPIKYGGTNRVVATLVSGLIDRGHEVTLYSKPGSYVDGANHRHLPSGFESSFDWLDKSLDFVHMHHPHRVITDIPMLVSQQGNGLSRIFPHMSFVSQSHAANHGSECYVHNGVDLNSYPKNVKDDYLVFLADAKWGVKNLRTAVSLAEDSKTKLLVMGGEGINSKYVSYLGMIGEADGKLEILSKAKGLLYLANWDEPCAVAILESLACGTPVLATSNGCFPEIINDSCGKCVKSYGEALRALSHIESIDSESCRERISGGFTAGQMVARYETLYEKILGNNWNYSVPSHTFKNRVRKLYKPTLRNILHFEVKHRLSQLRRNVNDYSYRLAPDTMLERCNF